MKFQDAVMRVYLIAKAKVTNLYKAKLVQQLAGADITFIFLFLGLHLLGYEWSWQTLLASFAAWMVVKELFKYLRSLAREFK